MAYFSQLNHFSHMLHLTELWNCVSDFCFFWLSSLPFITVTVLVVVSITLGYGILSLLWDQWRVENNAPPATSASWADSESSFVGRKGTSFKKKGQTTLPYFVFTQVKSDSMKSDDSNPDNQKSGLETFMAAIKGLDTTKCFSGKSSEFSRLDKVDFAENQSDSTVDADFLSTSSMKLERPHDTVESSFQQHHADGSQIDRDGSRSLDDFSCTCTPKSGSATFSSGTGRGVVVSSSRASAAAPITLYTGGIEGTSVSIHKTGSVVVVYPNRLQKNSSTSRVQNLPTEPTSGSNENIPVAKPNTSNMKIVIVSNDKNKNDSSEKRGSTSSLNTSAVVNINNNQIIVTSFVPAVQRTSRGSISVSNNTDPHISTSNATQLNPIAQPVDRECMKTSNKQVTSTSAEEEIVSRVSLEKENELRCSSENINDTKSPYSLVKVMESKEKGDKITAKKQSQRRVKTSYPRSENIRPQPTNIETATTSP